MDIEHVTEDGDSHGPVAVFVSNAGTIAFVCQRDRAYWEGAMPQVTPPSGPSDAPGRAYRTDAVDGGPDHHPRNLGLERGDDADGVMTLAQARELAVSRMDSTDH